MSAAAPQLDLFAPAVAERIASMPERVRIDLAPVLAIVAPAPVPGGLTAEARAWHERTMLAWSRRAEALRIAIAAGDVSRGTANRLFGLEWHVRRLRGALGGQIAPAPAVEAAPAERRLQAVAGGAVAAEIARLRASLVQWQPRFDAKLNCDVNGGPITAEIRAQIQAKIDAMEGGA